MKLQWWCAAGARGWTWTPTAYPGVWIVMLIVALAYWRLTRGTVPKGDRLLGWIGVLLLELALDWPIGPLAAGFLASAHALQFLLVVLVAPPLLLIGARHNIARRWRAERATARVLTLLTQPMIAAVAFNVIIISTHVPSVNDGLMPLQLGAFAVDIGWLLAGLMFWWPIVVPVPIRPLFASIPLRMLYLFLGTMVHTGVAIVMLMGEHPMYGVYELAPRATEMSAMTDIKIAGGIMELGGAGLIFGILTVMFFRWSGGTGAERSARAR